MTDNEPKIPGELEVLLHCLRCDLPLGRGETIMRLAGSGINLYHKQCWDRVVAERGTYG